jgi:hypothetical protein
MTANKLISKINIPVATKLALQAWNHVTVEVIGNCFAKAGLKSREDIVDEVLSENVILHLIHGSAEAGDEDEDLSGEDGNEVDDDEDGMDPFATELGETIERITINDASS